MNNFRNIFPCLKSQDENISLDPISYPDPNPTLKEIQIIRQYHPNGKLRRKYTLVGKLKEGPCLEWYPSGQLAYQYSFKNNKKHGLYYGWWEDGVPGFRKHYRNGYLDGLQLNYSENGRFYSVEKCSMGAVLSERVH